MPRLLRDSFLAAMNRPAADSEKLEPLLEERCATAEQAWPNISLSREIFVRHLASKVGTIEALEGLRASDLYLACACSRGDPAAAAAFEKSYFPTVDAALGRMTLSPTAVDEVKQLRVQLLMPEGKEPSSLATYSGKGDLHGWVRSVAVRLALKVSEKDRRHISSDENLAGIPSPGHDAELALLKEKYAADFNAAFAASVQALESRDRNILRQHYIDGLTVDELAPLYRVHRATAARWIAKIRATLLEQTRERLLERLKVQPQELESIMRLVRSQLEVSLQDFLTRAR
jgi:RNA polymerase sigma-70 factor, ECF subfamily